MLVASSKKAAVFSVVWLTVPLVVASAQRPDSAYSGIRIGVSAGVSRASPSGTGNITADSVGFLPGAYVAVPISHAFTMEAGVRYARKGGWDGYPDAGSTGYKMDYVEVPVLLRVKGVGSLAPFFQGGLAPAFLTSCRMYTSSGFVISPPPGPTLGTCAEVDPTHPARRLDIGAVAGAGLAYEWRVERIWASAQFDHGVTSAFSGSKVRNSMFALAAGVESRLP